MRSVAWRVVTEAPPAPRRNAGQISIPPLTSATATRKILSLTNLKRSRSAISCFRQRVHDRLHRARRFFDLLLAPDQLENILGFPVHALCSNFRNGLL